MIPLALLAIFVVIIMIPFLVMRALGYKQGVLLGTMVVYAIVIYLWSCFTGVLWTVLFEPSNTMHFKNYAEVMPKLYSHHFWSSISYPSSLANLFWLFPLLLLDLIRVSTHYIFTHSTYPTWISMSVGFFIIACMISDNLHELIPNRFVWTMEKEPEYDVFGNRNISLAEEEAEIARFLEKAKGGRYT